MGRRTPNDKFFKTVKFTAQKSIQSRILQLLSQI